MTVVPAMAIVAALGGFILCIAYQTVNRRETARQVLIAGLIVAGVLLAWPSRATLALATVFGIAAMCRFFIVLSPSRTS
jgi:hypothetical protein